MKRIALSALLLVLAACGGNAPPAPPALPVPIPQPPPVVRPPPIVYPPPPIVKSEGTATLSWVAPTQNIDGSALTNLAGYRIYTQHGGTITVTTVGVGIQTYTFVLPVGVYVFSVTAVNTLGVESAPSALATFTVS